VNENALLMHRYLQSLFTRPSDALKALGALNRADATWDDVFEVCCRVNPE